MFPGQVMVDGSFFVDPNVKLITGADPAAGAEFSETVPAGKAWLPLSLRFALVTDATVANRYVDVVVDDGTTEFFRTGFTQAHTASVTRTYSFAPSFGDAVGSTTSNQFAHPWVLTVIPDGYRIRSSSTNLQAGDNLSAPMLYVVEYRTT